MFWNLVFAHLTADYILQTDWMVRNRDKPGVMLLHAGIHFAMMFLMSGSARLSIWFYLVVIAAVHIGQDLFKISTSRKDERFPGTNYLLDQGAHFSLLFLASVLFRGIGVTSQIAARQNWVIIAITLVFITYVWFISERIFYSNDPDYLTRVNQTKFQRMAARVGLVSLFLLARDAAIRITGLSAFVPYTDSVYRKREIVIDAAVSLSSIVFLIFMLT